MTDHPAPRAHSPPSRSHDDEPPASSSSSPVTACRRCRKQKLRCSREVPTCKRCKDISALCEYPPPPDRKLLAAQRLQNAKVRARRESEAAASTRQDQRRLSEHADAARSLEAPLHYDHSARSESNEASEQGSHSVHDEYQVSTPPPPLSLKKTNMPSSEVAVFLIEIYFARLYNAHLLFHKGSFLADFAANRVPDFIALAIFASASLFLRRASERSQQLPGEDGDGVEFGLSMLSAADWRRQGDDWANAASQQALMQADAPRSEVVQGCQCLALYWWAVGRRERTHLHANVSYLTARMLSLGEPSDESDDTLTDEVRRRLFWACWMNECMGQEKASFKAEPWKDAIGVKFPSDEESWLAGRPSSKEMFDDKGNVVNIDGSEVTPNASEEGALVKLLGTWWESCRFVDLIKQDTVESASSTIARLHTLDVRLNKILEDLHPNLQYVNVTSFTSTKVNHYRLFAFHALHRSTSCALHASIVPLFANTCKNSFISKRIVRLAAEEAVKHAGVILDMATAFIGSRSDISRCPPIIGYTMYMALKIQLKSLSAQQKLQAYSTSRFKAAVVILDRLKEYWHSMRGLWINLKATFASTGIDINAIPTHPRYQLNSDDQNTDLDKIVSQEGTTRGSDTTAVYTYVPNEEGKISASPRRSSDGTQSRRTKSAHNTPPSGNTSIQVDSHGHTLPIHQRQDAEIQPSRQVYGQPQHHNAQPQTQNFEQHPFAGAGHFRQQSFNAMGSNNYLHLGTVPEDYQTQVASVPMPYAAVPAETPGVGQTMDAFGSMQGMMGTEMDVDKMNFWWDQSYETFDKEIMDPNANVVIGGEGFQFLDFTHGARF